MKTGITEPAETMAQTMRKIWNEISNEIIDMTFAAETAFLYKVLVEFKLRYEIKKTKNN